MANHINGMKWMNVLTSRRPLKPTYTIAYMPETQYLDINYYTDEVDELNLIASTTWGIAIDEVRTWLHL